MADLIAWGLLALLADSLLLFALVAFNKNFGDVAGSRALVEPTVFTRVSLALTFPAWLAVGLVFVVFSHGEYSPGEYKEDAFEVLRVIFTGKP